MIRTQIYIPSDLHQTAKMIALKKDQSLAGLLRMFITNGISEEKKNLKTKSLSSLARLNIMGGPKDLSKNMDKYIYG